MMDVLNISMDDNEGDTSQEEYIDHVDSNICSSPLAPLNKRFKSSSGHPIHKMYDFDREISRILRRPEVNMNELCAPQNAQNKAFKFMMTDCVSTLSRVRQPCIRINDGISKCPNPLVMRAFGVTENGHSVTCNVHGFLSYFYALPTNEFAEEDKASFVDILNKVVKKRILKDISCVEFHDTVNITSPIIDVEVLRLDQVDNVYHLFTSHLNESAKGSINKNKPLLKILCCLPKFVWVAAKVLKNGLISYPYTDGPCEYDLFEDSINSNIRFLTDKNLPGCGWLEVPAHKYYFRSDSDAAVVPKESHCQIEIDVHCDDLKAAIEVNQDIPPLRILSFDIEVMTAQENTMPYSGNQQVIQIGTTIAVYGNAEPLGKIILTLNDCESIAEAEIISFVPNQKFHDEHGNDIPQDEKGIDEEWRIQEACMLKAWRDLVIISDPDIITGYNINRFDLPYLIDRANVINCGEAKCSSYIGRMKNVRTVVREIQNPSKCSGNLSFDKYFVNIQGRVNFDMFRLLFRHDITRRGFSLKQVAERYLHNEVKGDVCHTEIYALQNGSSSDRKRLAIYCLQDAYLAYQLLLIPVPDRTNYGDFVEYYIQKSLSCGTLFRYTLNKSLSYSQYFKEIRKQKNPHTVFYVANTPSPKKPLRRVRLPEDRTITSRKNLFSDLVTAEANAESSSSK